MYNFFFKKKRKKKKRGQSQWGTAAIGSKKDPTEER
jgi:hypothetical protein